MGERWEVYNHATVSFVIEVMHRWGNQAALPTGPGSHWPTEAGHDDTVLETGSPRGSVGIHPSASGSLTSLLARSLPGWSPFAPVVST